MGTESPVIPAEHILSEFPALYSSASEENNQNQRMSHNDTVPQDQSESDNNELIVLDPDHPLLQRFQECLKTMLLKHLDKAEETLREKDEDLKREKSQHIESGVELYNFQQELAKFQVQLEKKHTEYEQIKSESEQAQENLKELRQEYQNCVTGLREDTKLMHTMREEVDTLSLRLFYLNNANDDMMGDIKVLKRAAAKATTDLSNFSDEKLRQDMLVDRLQTKVDQLSEDIALYDAQIIAQEAEMTSSQELLNEAEAQIVTISMDKKHLMSQWKTSLLGLQQRNEAFTALMDSYNQLKERLLVLENEQSAYKRSIRREQEKHEQMTMLVNKNEADLNTLKKQILQCETRHEADQQTYATYQRMLQESERNLAQAQNELKKVKNDVENLRKQIENESSKKVELESNITAELRNQLIAKKSMTYVKKLNVHVEDQTRELYTQIAELENQIARDELKTAIKKAENTQLEEQIKRIEEEVVERNNLINKLESEIHHATVMVERKQRGIDLLNKKLEALLRERGGQELGPLDAMINNLTKALQAKHEEIGDLEQQWLKEQNELVRHVNEKEALAKTVEKLQKQLTILAQKKVRVDNEIAVQEREQFELERELKHLQNDTVRLNALIAKEKQVGENLCNENKLSETDFVRSLREKETEVAELRSKLDNMQRDREDLLNELIEIERTIMLWEKKVQLCEETRRAVECDLGQGELSVMKHEIHRMEVRKSSLLIQQEKLMQALEQSVRKRDLIILQADSKKCGKNQAYLRITAQRQLNELKKKLKATRHMAKTCETEIREMEVKCTELEASVDEKRSELEREQKIMDELTNKLQNFVDEKQRYIIEVQLKQHESVYWEKVREGKYKRMCQSSAACNMESARQLNKIRTLLAIIDRLIEQFPQVQRDFAPVRKLLQERIHYEENKSDVDIAPIQRKRETRRRSKVFRLSK